MGQMETAPMMLRAGRSPTPMLPVPWWSEISPLRSASVEMTRGALANTVISSGAACRYGEQMETAPMMLRAGRSPNVMLPVPSEGEISPLRNAFVEMTEGAPFFYNLRPKGATTTLGLQGRQT